MWDEDTRIHTHLFRLCPRDLRRSLPALQKVTSLSGVRLIDKTQSYDERRLAVIVPTYQECESIRTLIESVLKVVPKAKVWVIDDRSPDNTAEVANDVSLAYPGHVSVEIRQTKSGLGSAYLYGFLCALKDGAEVIVEMDADLSHDPRDLPRLLEAIQNADLVIGSRYVPFGETRRWPWTRKFISRVGNGYARWALGVPIRDMTAGYRAIRREVVEALDLDSFLCGDFGFQIELTYRALLRGFRIQEIPIVFSQRCYGRSKFRVPALFDAFTLVWRLRRLRPIAPASP